MRVSTWKVLIATVVGRTLHALLVFEKEVIQLHPVSLIKNTRLINKHNK